MSKFKEHLFAAIFYSNECADDDTMFVSPEFKKWADEFEKWLSETEFEYPIKYKRTDYENVALFSADQENIWFTNNVNECPWIKNVFHCYIHSNSKGIDEFRYEP